MGTPNYEDGGVIPVITSLGSNVTEDGTIDSLSEDIVKQVKDLGYTINLEVTDSASLVEEDSEHHDHDGDGIDDHTGEVINGTAHVEDGHGHDEENVESTGEADVEDHEHVDGENSHADEESETESVETGNESEATTTATTTPTEAVTDKTNDET